MSAARPAIFPFTQSAIVSASAAQVREPVHTGSVGKWRRYEGGLKVLHDRLAAEGLLQA